MSSSTASILNVWWNGSQTVNSSTSYSYAMWDDARVSSSTHDSDTNSSSNPLWTSTYHYDGLGRLATINIADGRPRTVSFASGSAGHVLRRLERSSAAANPVDHYFYVDGRQVGELTNNGWHDPTRDDYAGTIETRSMKASTSDYPFRWNSQNAVTRGQFGGSGYDPVSPHSNGMQGANGRYTVRDGDTLAGIAQQVWGDSSLWYMIAEANGLNGGQTLAGGTSLIIPDKVVNLHNSGGTFQVYDPNRAFGDLNPTTATLTAAKPPKKANKCGMFGAILLVAIAVAVTVVTSGAALAALSPMVGSIGAGITAMATGFAGATAIGAGSLIAAGAIGGAVGSIVSQGVGVASGLQDKFSWKAVAMAGISGAVSAGVGASGAFARVGSTFARGALSGATSSALSQGIGVATGLQKKFDFAGVAAAGLGGGVSASVGKTLGAGPLSDMSARNIGANLASSTAGAIANAATRSLVQGTNFGDNILAALPDVIGSTIGNMIGGAVAGRKSALDELGPRSRPSFDGAELSAPEGDLAGLLAKLPGGDLGSAIGSQSLPNVDRATVDLLVRPSSDLETHLAVLGERALFGLGDVHLASSGWPAPNPFGDGWLQEQLYRYTPEGIFDALRSGARMATLDAMVGAPMQAAEGIFGLGTADHPAAGRILREFRLGEGPATRMMGPNTRFSSGFAASLSTGVIVSKALEEWATRPGGWAANGGRLTGFIGTFGSDAFQYATISGSAEAHVIGSFRLSGRLLDRNRIEWTATNEMSLRSYFADRLTGKVGIHSVNNNHRPQPYGNTTQIIIWHTDRSGRVVR